MQRAEIKAGAADSIEGQLDKIKELMEKFCEKAFQCTVHDLPSEVTL